MKRVFTIIFLLIYSICNSQQIGLNGNIKTGAFNWSSNTFVDAVGTLNGNIIRYPGGLASDNFDWKTGYADGTSSGNRNNLSDLKNAVNRLHCGVIFVLNMVTHDLAYNMQMLRTADSMGIPVKYIEMANEVSNGGAPTQYFKNGANYADTCKKWIFDSIKVIFPTVQCALWGKDQADLPTWNDDILARFTPDAFVTHYYPPVGRFVTDGVVDTTKLDILIDRSFENSGLNPQFVTIPIWVTETNLNVDADFSALSPENYVFILTHMVKKYRQNPNIQIILFHNVVGNEGTYDDDLNILPTGVAMKGLHIQPFVDSTFGFSLYGDQEVKTIAGHIGLLHLPATYYKSTNKYPLIIQNPGAGESTIADINDKYIAKYFLDSSWDGTAFNYKSNKTDSFIVFSLAQAITGNIYNQFEDVLDAIRANYRIQDSSLNLTGFSRGAQLTTWYPIHLSSASPLVHFTPKYKLATVVPMSGEITGNEPMDFANTDTVYVWAFGDTTGSDGHGQFEIADVDRLRKINPLLTVRTPHNFGHAVDNFYSPKFIQNVSGIGMNIYNYMLYHKRNSPVITPPTNSISTGSISTSFCVTPSVGANVTIPFTSIGTYSNNTYTAQLSDKGGNFVSPYTIIGTLVSNSNSGNINSVIPGNTPFGNKYRVRIISSNPSIVGSDNGSDITISLASNSVSPSGDQTIQINSSGVLLSVTDASPPTSRTWFYGTTSGGPYNTSTGISATTYTPSFSSVGTYYIVCKSVFPCTTITSNEVKVVVTAQSTAHKIYVTKQGLNCGVLWTTGNPGDSLILQGSLNPYCYITFQGVNGTTANPITILNEGGVIENPQGSFKLLDCHHINVNFGTNTSDPVKSGVINGVNYSIRYGYESDGQDTYGGPGFEIRGKSTDIEASNMYIHNRGKWGTNAGYAIIMKNDPNDYGCDTSYDYPNEFVNVTLHDFLEFNIQQDANYFGSSIGYNAGHQQGQLCNGKLIYPVPTGIRNLLCYNFIDSNISRSAFQIGQVRGHSVFHDCHGYNIGYSNDNTQGAMFAIGSPADSVEIFNCTANLTFKPAVYTKNFGKFNIHNNTFDSSGWIYDTLHILRTNPVLNIEMYPDSNTSNIPLQFVIKNNTLRAHSNPAGNIALFPGKTGNYSQIGDTICNISGNTVYHSGININWVGCTTQTNTITTSSIGTSVYCVKTNAGTPITINGTSIGAFTSGNVYTAQMSDKNGSFASPVTLGTQTTTSNSISISGTIPQNTPSGSGYRVRIISDNPFTTGSISPTIITTNLADNSIAPIATQTIFTGTDGTLLTVTEASPAISRLWYANGISLGLATVGYIPRFNIAGTYIITCKSTFACGIISSNPITVIVQNLPPPVPDTISLSSFSGAPVCVTASSGGNLTVNFISNRTTAFNTGNVFTAQLSAIDGKFGSHTNIGTLPSTATSGTINATIPAGTVPSNKYRVRVTSSNPTATYIRSASQFTISYASNNISPTGDQAIFTGQYGAIITVTESSSPTSRLWYYGTSSGTYPTSTGDDSAIYTPIFGTAGTYYIVCKSIFPCATITNNEVKIVVTDEPPPPPDTVCYHTQTVPRDTLIPKTFSKDSIMYVTQDTTICKYFRFLWFVFNLGCSTIYDTTLRRDTIVIYDSLVPSLTTPRDTIICIITGFIYNLKKNDFSINNPRRNRLDISGILKYSK